jgi:hypothetical protein
MDEGLVVEQLGGVLGGERGAATDPDPAGRRRGIGRQFVDQDDLGRSVAEVFLHLAADERRDLVAGT